MPECGFRTESKVSEPRVPTTIRRPVRASRDASGKTELRIETSLIGGIRWNAIPAMGPCTSSISLKNCCVFPFRPGVADAGFCGFSAAHVIPEIDMTNA